MDAKKLPQREQTTIRLPAELKEQLQQEADKRGYSFNTLLLIIFKQAVNQFQI